MHTFAKLSAVIMLTIVAMVVPRTVRAGIYSDDLSRCLVEHTTDDDKIALAQWIFAVISVHPSAASMANISESNRADISRKSAQIFQTLLTESCKDQTSKAVKYEGTAALGVSFKVLGEIAMAALLADPKVAAESQNFTKYLDETKLKAVFGTAPAGG